MSGSAVGYYGNRGDAELDEDALVGQDFAARLCLDREKAALTAERVGVSAAYRAGTERSGRHSGAHAHAIQAGHGCAYG